MRIDIITIFPKMFPGPLGHSILGRAQQEGLIELVVHDLRDYTTDRHRVVDDYPYGGGQGMVMKPEPIFRAVRSIKLTPNAKTILLCPQGRMLNQDIAWKLSREKQIILLCGHYEGVDERVRRHLAIDEISIGDYILTGGELPAMVLVDVLARLQPGVLGDAASPLDESFTDGLLEYPQYTRPAKWEALEVPAVLLSGHHEKIRRWRRKEALRNTLLKRPDLLAKVNLSTEDQLLLAELKEELSR